MSKRRRAAIIAACALLAAAIVAWLVVPNIRIGIAERAALDQLGKPYVFGKAGPESFDCSGLMKYAYGKAGVKLAHNTKAVAGDDRYRTIDDPAKLRRGDLVYFDTVSGGSKTDHVGFWLGGNRFVHASSAKHEVMISEFDEKWQKRFSLAKRIL